MRYNDYIWEADKELFLSILNRLILFKKLQERGIEVKDEYSFLSNSHYGYSELIDWDILQMVLEKTGIGKIEPVDYEQVVWEFELTINGLEEFLNHKDSFPIEEQEKLLGLINSMIEGNMCEYFYFEGGGHLKDNGKILIQWEYGHGLTFEFFEWIEEIYQKVQELLKERG